MKKILLIAIGLLIGLQNIQAQVIENFETWNPYTIGLVFGVQMNEPAGWSCTDSFIVGIGKSIPSLNSYQSQLIKESPGYAGTGSMRAVTKLQGPIGLPGFFSFPARDYPAIVSNATFSLDIANFSFGQSGGTSINFAPSVTRMYVKNSLVGGDSTFITASLLKQGNGSFDTIIAVADTVLSSNISSYTQISLPFNYILPNQSPNLIRYTISSGNPLALLDTSGTFSVNDGTEIVVDNIELSAPNGIRQLINANPIAKVYPTFGSEILYIDLFKKLKDVEIDIHTLSGQLIQSYELLNNQNQVSISDLSNGTYIFSLKADGVIYQTGKFLR